MAKTTRRAPGERAYPYASYASGLKVAEAVKQYGGGRDTVPRNLIAKHLNMDEGSANFSNIVSTAKCFGMIEGDRDCSLSKLGSRYFFPSNGSDRRAAELAFLATPSVFKFLLDRFDGRLLPGTDKLANLMAHERILGASWAGRVAACFMGAVRALGLVDNLNHLRYGATLAEQRSSRGPHRDQQTGADEGLEEDVPPPINEQVKSRGPEPRAARPEVAGLNSWAFSESGGSVLVETTDPLPRALWLRLKRYVDVLEPSNGGENEKKT